MGFHLGDPHILKIGDIFSKTDFWALASWFLFKNLI